MDNLGRVLIYVGLIITAVGGVIYFLGLSWFGHLPGDIMIDKENFKLYFPLASMILISVAINLIIYIVRFFLK